MPVFDLLLGGILFSIMVSAIDFCRSFVPVHVDEYARYRAHIVAVPTRR